MSLNREHKSNDALGSVKEPLIAAAAAAVTQQVEHTVDLDKENMRYLWTPPTLFQDWDEEYEERAAAWWELFVDLVLVAACSNIADGFKEDPTSAGFGLFALQLLVYYTLWNQYVGYSSRFRDDSLGHSVLLFIYIAGAACMVVHSGAKDPADILGFSVGMILQKGAMVLMQVIVYIWIPRARVMTGIMLAEAAVFFVCIGAAAGFPNYAGGQLALAMWGTVLVTEQIFRLGFGLTCGKQILPINIDHFTDRLGCCVMVILGESIVSESISYRALPEHARTAQYYGAALLGLLMTFGIALIYFHLQPLRERHAFRVSRYRGMVLEYGQRSLGVALLAVGVGIKFAMAAVVGEAGEGQDGAPTGRGGAVSGGGQEQGREQEQEQEQEQAGSIGGLSSCDPSMMSPLRVWVLLGSLSCVMASLFVLRLAHYGGVEPRPSDATGVYRLKMFWWLVVGSNCIPPLVAAGVLTGGSLTDGCTPVDDARRSTGDSHSVDDARGSTGEEVPEPENAGGLGTHPLTALAVGAGCTVGVVCLESIVTHILKDTVLVARARRAGGGTVSGDLIAEWLVEPDGGSSREGEEQEGGDGPSA